MLHDALYSQNSLKNFSSKIAWVWLTYIWPFLYYKKTILEWKAIFWIKFFEGILWIRAIMEHQLRPPRGFVVILQYCCMITMNFWMKMYFWKELTYFVKSLLRWLQSKMQKIIIFFILKYMNFFYLTLFHRQKSCMTLFTYSIFYIHIKYTYAGRIYIYWHLLDLGAYLFVKNWTNLLLSCLGISTVYHTVYHMPL